MKEVSYGTRMLSYSDAMSGSSTTSPLPAQLERDGLRSIDTHRKKLTKTDSGTEMLRSPVYFIHSGFEVVSGFGTPAAL